MTNFDYMVTSKNINSSVTAELMAQYIDAYSNAPDETTKDGILNSVLEVFEIDLQVYNEDLRAGIRHEIDLIFDMLKDLDETIKDGEDLSDVLIGIEDLLLNTEERIEESKNPEQTKRLLIKKMGFLASKQKVEELIAQESTNLRANSEDVNSTVTIDSMKKYIDDYFNAPDEIAKNSILDLALEAFELNLETDPERLIQNTGEVKLVFGIFKDLDETIRYRENSYKDTLIGIEDLLINTEDAIQRTKDSEIRKILLMKQLGFLVFKEKLNDLMANYKNYPSHGARLMDALNEPNKLLEEYETLTLNPSFNNISKKFKKIFQKELKICQEDYKLPKNCNTLGDVLEAQNNMIKEFDGVLPHFDEIENIPTEVIKKLLNIASRINSITGTEDYIQRVKQYDALSKEKRLLHDETGDEVAKIEARLMIITNQLNSRLQMCIDNTALFLAELQKNPEMSVSANMINDEAGRLETERLKEERAKAIEDLECEIQINKSEIKPKKKKRFFAKLISIIKNFFKLNKKVNATETSYNSPRMDPQHCNETSGDEGKNKISNLKAQKTQEEKAINTHTHHAEDIKKNKNKSETIGYKIL